MRIYEQQTCNPRMYSFVRRMTCAKELKETIQMHKRNVKKLSTSYQIRRAEAFWNRFVQSCNAVPIEQHFQTLLTCADVSGPESYEILVKFGISSEILGRFFSINKIVYFRTLVGNVRKWRHNWHDGTTRHSQKVRTHEAECQISTYNSLCSHKQGFSRQSTQEQEGTWGMLVSCT